VKYYVAGEEIRAELVVELREDGKLYIYDTGTPGDKIIGINPMLVQTVSEQRAKETRVR